MVEACVVVGDGAAVFLPAHHPDQGNWARRYVADTGKGE